VRKHKKKRRIELTSEKRSACEDVGFGCSEKRAASVILNQPAPELSKRRPDETFRETGAPPLMRERRINSVNHPLFNKLAQADFMY